MKPILKKCPDNIILHVVTNNAAREPARTVFDKPISLKSFIEKMLSNCKISISNLIKRTDNNEAAKTVDKVNELLFTSQLGIVDNNNITKSELTCKALHLNDIGYAKLAVNFIWKIKNFKRSWQLTGSFSKTLKSPQKSVCFYEASDKPCFISDSQTKEFDSLNEMRKVNPNRLNSMRNKFEMLKATKTDKTDKVEHIFVEIIYVPKNG